MKNKNKSIDINTLQVVKSRSEIKDWYYYLSSKRKNHFEKSRILDTPNQALDNAIKAGKIYIDKEPISVNQKTLFS